MKTENVNLTRNDDNISFEGTDGRIVIEQEKKSPDTIVYLYSGQTCRKITIKNVANVSEALRDSLVCMPAFVRSSKTLTAVHVAYRKNIWPTLDNKKLVPTFENVDITKLNLSSRAENALEKNDIGVIGQIPETVEDIKKLRSVGVGVAKEIFGQKKKFLKTLGATTALKPRKKVAKKAKPVKTKKVKKSSKRELILDSALPSNLKEILMANMIAYTDEVPKDIGTLLKLKKLGPSKARQILDSLG